MHSVRATYRVNARLGQAEISNLSAGLQFGHRADRFLDWHARVDTVLIIDVDRRDAQSLQRRLARATHVFRRPIDPEPRSVFLAHVAELCCEHDLVATVANGLADEPLVREWPVNVGGVQKIDAEIQRSANRRNRLRVVTLTVELGHSHAAETDGRDHRTAAPKLTSLHDVTVFILRICSR